MNRRILTILMLLVLFLGLGLLVSGIKPPGYTRLDLTEDGTGRSLLSVVLKDGEGVSLEWRNSLFGVDVTEGFFARGGLIVQERVRFSVPGGPPPPRVAPGDVEDLYHTGGPFDARGLSRPFSRIVYRISEIGNPRLRVRDRTVLLKEEVGFGGRVVLSTSRPTLPEIFLRR
jgi:hypothetical protein